MAEIAIPVVALGIMYLLSNEREGYENENEEKTRNKLVMGDSKTGIPVNKPVNYPKETHAELNHNPAAYVNPSSATDRYFRQEKYEKAIEQGGNPNVTNSFKSLTGEEVNKSDIKFNNMVPFFGSKVRQRGVGSNEDDSILDNYVGSGKQEIHKTEQAPLFSPEENLSYTYGAPNQSDFIQSRMNPSKNMSNTKPWEEVLVAPGLNNGYTSQGSSGFNSGMDARKEWADKTVDELRVKTNPKVTFGLANHEGPAISAIKERGFEGKIEKNRPDTYYINTPERWFTTTGQEKAQRTRAEEPLQTENRPFTTREYFGTASADQNGSTKPRVEENYRRSNRPELEPNTKYLGPAHNLNYAYGWKNLKQNYGKDGYKSYPNARSTTQQSTEFGGVNGLVKAVITPVLDMLRPSRKENVVGNMRVNGNAGGNYGVNQAHVFNPNDRPRTTIKEQTEETYDVAQPHYKHDGGYATMEYQPVENQRQTTNVSYTGNSSAAPWAQKGQTYNAAYNANINPNKEKLLKNQINQGCEPLFNSHQNIRIRRDDCTNSATGLMNMPKESANISTYGEMGGRNTRGAMIDNNRNNTDILNAFNQNPFTKPLDSIA
jgi:hypothetical protein